MKHRGWVPVVALVLTVIIGGGYLGWHLSGAEEKIRETLLSRIRPFLAQESDIEKVKIDLSNVHVQGVRLSPRDRAFSVDIQEVTLGFRLWSLILHGFSLEKVTHEITLVHPVIILNKDKTATGVSDGQDWLDVSEVAEALRSVKRILVVSGEIFVSDSLENGVRLAHSLTGWMASDPLDSAFVQVTGKLFESRENNHR